ncbi:hypothetical protein H4R24_004656 [Coemansia sp. RSA 988]|nr:hypothetical protein H4R24_004656 [Coemansia sp. RSA 988]
MSNPKKKTQGSREITVINIRAISRSKSNLFDMTNRQHGRLSKKPSSTLAQIQQSGKTADETRASSLPSESMYRYALRANHHSTAKDSAVSTTPPKKKLAEIPTQPVGSAKGNSKQTAEDQMVWVHVHYVQGDKRKRIMFPPGILVEQARDLCMLRFGVWQEIMKRGATPQTNLQQSESASSIDDDTKSVSTQSTISSGSTNSSGTTREQFGLYWPGHAQWLESQTPLSRYMLSNGDRLELQNHSAFVATPVLSRNNIRHKASDSGVSRAEVLEEGTMVEGEGQIYYLQNKGISTAWRQCWLELHGTTLVCYKRAGRLRMGLGMARSTRDASLVLIDLAGGFRLVDQHGRRDQKVSTSEQLSGGSSSASSVSSSVQSFSWMGTYQQLGGNGAPLLIKCDGSKEVHIFCTYSAVDYDYWRRLLRKVQMEYKLPTNITVSSSGSSRSGVSGRSDSVDENIIGSRERQYRALHAKTPSTNISEDKTSATSAAAATSLVHRPQERRAPACVIARPRREQRFMDTMRVRVGGQHDNGLREELRALEDAQTQTFCVLVPQTLFGFSGSYNGPSDEHSMATAAKFSVDLRNTRVHTMSETCGRKTMFVICILRTTGGTDSDGEAEVLLGFDVDSRESCSQWTEALYTIGGVNRIAVGVTKDVQKALGSPQPQLRRVRSSVSTISHADWPMPPTTLPATQPILNAVPAPVSRVHGQNVANGLPNSMTSMQLEADDTQAACGNPSLDAVGMRFTENNAQQPEQEQQPSRFPWLRRNIFRPNSDYNSYQ